MRVFRVRLWGSVSLALCQLLFDRHVVVLCGYTTEHGHPDTQTTQTGPPHCQPAAEPTPIAFAPPTASSEVLCLRPNLPRDLDEHLLERPAARRAVTARPQSRQAHWQCRKPNRPFSSCAQPVHTLASKARRAAVAAAISAHAHMLLQPKSSTSSSFRCASTCLNTSDRSVSSVGTSNVCVPPCCGGSETRRERCGLSGRLGTTPACGRASGQIHSAPPRRCTSRSWRSCW